MKQHITDLIGTQSSSDRNELIRRMRFHQGWWRSCVLGEEEGPHPTTMGKTICSTISGGEGTHLNFLDTHARQAVQQALEGRKEGSRGMIETGRLYNNLLGSQPLCFNFFGRLQADAALATKVLSKLLPGVREVTAVLFEFGPAAATNADNSAHDVAIEFIDLEGRRCLVGIECKYTEAFSPTPYSKPSYHDIYLRSGAFSALYEDLIAPAYNQLFRNQLLAESARLANAYDKVYGALLCHHNDKNAVATGSAFQSMLHDGAGRFAVITFGTFIAAIQQCDINWETREWSMLLWARYCGEALSNRFYS